MSCCVQKSLSETSRLPFCLPICYKTVRTSLHDLSLSFLFSRKRDIYDNMMDIMEKHVNNLEELVEKRTGLLAEEKKKTETLLHRMLPP